ncbi:MAG: hypothetical protein AB2689_16240 [Candidatus Thiodiazotropha taylori]
MGNQEDKNSDQVETKPKPSHHETQDNLITIELSGRNPERWKARKPRFLQRIGNSVKKLLGADIKPQFTADEELNNTAEEAIKSAKEAIRKPQLENEERQASIQLKLAEVKEKEAYARRTNLEADMLEIEIESKLIHESQEIIDRLIQRGALIPIEKDGELYFIYNKDKA